MSQPAQMFGVVAPVELLQIQRFVFKHWLWVLNRASTVFCQCPYLFCPPWSHFPWHQSPQGTSAADIVVALCLTKRWRVRTKKQVAKKQWPHVLWFVFFLDQVTIARAAETVLHLVLTATSSNVFRFEFAPYSDGTGVDNTKLKRIDILCCL